MNQTIEIPKSILTQAEEQVEQGRFKSVDEALGHVAAQLRQYDRDLQKLQGMTDKSLASGPPRDAEAVFERIHQRLI